MLLYRCADECPVKVISPSNWATGSSALARFVHIRIGNLQPVGRKIIVIDLPTPSVEDIGPYTRVNDGAPDAAQALPFGHSEQKGWWSFNRAYTGAFHVVAVLELAEVGILNVCSLDGIYKRAE